VSATFGERGLTRSMGMSQHCADTAEPVAGALASKHRLISDFRVKQ
jgi:hypothetical protein